MTILTSREVTLIDVVLFLRLLLKLSHIIKLDSVRVLLDENHES
jgi:hypothetical protein